MRLRFDAHQQFQLDAIKSVTEVFQGQARSEGEIPFAMSSDGPVAVPNRLDLDEASLLENLRRVQQQHELPLDSEVKYIERPVESAAGELTARFPNISVEMETGTGKTYVYVRTVLELYERYGFRKFIVVVPSVAIREGVLKTLALTREHLRALYSNPPYRYYEYKAEALSHVRQFALSDGVEVMVMTIDSFNKATNVLRQESTDRLQGETPIHLLQAAQPILILDEPQNMEGEGRLQALAELNPLLALRYSATHRNPYNNVYRLSPFEAYRQGLVKRIEVASVLRESEVSQPFVEVVDIRAKGKTPTAKMAVHKLMKTGVVQTKTVTVKPGDTLERKTERSEYAEYVVDEINPGSDFVRFANGTELRSGEAVGADKDALFEAQIRYTIEEHFRKQTRLRTFGLKVLSLFFIDRVASYAHEDGTIRTKFERLFNELKGAHDDWKDVSVEDVHAGYFSQQRRRKTGETDFVESSGDESDRSAYDLIMKDKERLLTFEEPVSFIFSHSALREGWDSPNVFQLCTLNQTASELKKRQEVGRGMRLPVDQTGERQTDVMSAVLTVVANESYELYVSGLQKEIEAEYGVPGTPPAPGNARKRGFASLEKHRLLSPEFRELWERIKHRTRYSVEIDPDQLVADAVADLDGLWVKRPRVTITKAQIQVQDDVDLLEALRLSSAKTVQGLEGRFPLPNLIELMTQMLQHTSPPMYLTRGTLLDVFRGLKSTRAAIDNPQEFATGAARVLKARLADQLVDGIKYTKLGESYEMTQFDAEIESWERYLVPGVRGVYDQAVVDSGTERKFVEALEKRDDVLVYVKLPGWFKVRTPIGEYNPDWALVMEDRDEHGDPTGKPLLYLVRETKSTHDRQKLRPDERRKIACAERHFVDTLDVDYKVVISAGELP